MVTQEMFQSGEIDRSKLFIMTKTGYIPKDQLLVHDGDKDEGIVHNAVIESHHEMINLSEVSPIMDSLYSLEGEMHEQNLSLSLESLQTDYVDALFLHNPEHYIEYQRKANVSIPPFEEKLMNSFLSFEREVINGRIRSYGISCNWLSNPEECDNLNYRKWPELAHEAWAKANDKKINGDLNSSFKHIQMPGNLLESYGINHTSVWAKSNNLNVFINRPLEAIDSKGQWRLASYTGLPHSKYMEVLEKTLSVFEPHRGDENKKFLATLIKDMERERPAYTSLYHYKYDFEHSIYPMVTEKLMMLREVDSLVAMQIFLNAYEFKVRESASLVVEDYIETNPHYKGKYSSKKQPLQKFAMEHLLSNNNIDCVLNGMLREEYVDQTLQLLSTL